MLSKNISLVHNLYRFKLFLGTMADDTNLQPVIGGATSNFLQKSTTLLLPLILLAQLF